MQYLQVVLNRTMFAIVDIETTGGHASANGITEIAIVLHNGESIEGKFSTLVNPNMAIPTYVQSLTGITDQMVQTAPQFNTVAPNIFNLLKDRVFVAHNVNFDYSFVKHHLQEAGFELNTPKLCTIRLARKIFPGHTRYGLENICRTLGIENTGRHRALGDALATTELFARMLAADTSGELSKMTKSRSNEQYLPPNLPEQTVANLPMQPGVYYFHDAKGKIIYVGKAKQIKQRVISHFSNNKSSRQKQEFLKHVHHISYKVCGTELMAAILESIEIKRLWPRYNQSQKKNERSFGLYLFEDNRGYWRLIVDTQKQHLKALHSFGSLLEGRQVIKSLIDKFQLCPKLCFLDLSPGKTLAELQGELPVDYNKKVNAAIHYLQQQLPSFIIREDGADEQEQSCILIEKGRFAGMGQIPKATDVLHADSIKPLLNQYPENAYIRNLVFQYANKYPKRVNHLYVAE